MRTLLVALLVSACGGTATTTPAEPPPPAPEVVAKAATPENPAVAHGAEVFAQNCASCHGPDGRGDGAAGAALDPKPADLRGPRAAHLKGIPRRQIIEEGRPGTAMIGWKAVLSPEDLDAVYAFVHDMHHGPDGQKRGGMGGGMGGGG